MWFENTYQYQNVHSTTMSLDPTMFHAPCQVIMTAYLSALLFLLHFYAEDSPKMVSQLSSLISVLLYMPKLTAE